MTDGPPLDVDSAAAHLRDFADGPLRRLPLYRHLARRAGEDREVASLLLRARPPVRWATLLLAAVHERLLEVHDRCGADDASAAEVEPLCAWYRSTAKAPRSHSSGADDPWPHFRRLALEDPAVAEHMATRGTQTNEVGRSATTVVALGLTQREVERPLSLIEVGASAGLNLRPDARTYLYPPAGEADPDEILRLDPAPAQTVGADAITLTSRWRDGVAPPVPAEMPMIAGRVGVDLQPVDVRDDASARWLVSCQWPEQFERLDRCRLAIAGARREPPRLVEGDLVATVADLVRAVPRGVHPVVLSTWCLAYLDPQEQRAFLGELDAVGEERDLTLIYQEQAIAVPGIGPPPRPDGLVAVEPTALCQLEWSGGRRVRHVRLADQHPHGTWARWFDRHRR